MRRNISKLAIHAHTLDYGIKANNVPNHLRKEITCGRPAHPKPHVSRNLSNAPLMGTGKEVLRRGKHTQSKMGPCTRLTSKQTLSKYWRGGRHVRSAGAADTARVSDVTSGET